MQTTNDKNNQIEKLSKQMQDALRQAEVKEKRPNLLFNLS